ncbi:hypothetical protein SALBM311S_12331 [Streptomyces alboniger]
MAYPRAEDRGDREGAAALRQSQGEDQPAGSGGQQDGEGEFDAGQADEVDGGEAGADGAAALREVGDGGTGQLLGGCAAICFWWLPPVSRRKAPTASLPVALAM